jgi:hypothetical protein
MENHERRTSGLYYDSLNRWNIRNIRNILRDLLSLYSDKRFLYLGIPFLFGYRVLTSD